MKEIEKRAMAKKKKTPRGIWQIRSLFFFGHVKECLALLLHLLKQAVRDAHVFEVEEAHLHQRMPQPPQKLGLGRRVLGLGQIQDGDRSKRHLRMT